MLTPAGGRKVYDGSIWSAIGRDGIFMAALARGYTDKDAEPLKGFAPLPVIFSCTEHQALVAHELSWSVTAYGTASHVMIYMRGEHIMTCKIMNERRLIPGDMLNISEIHFPTWMDT